MDASIKVCTTCKEPKSTDNFGRHKQYKDGLKRQCKKCLARINKEYEDRNRETIRTRKRNYMRGPKAQAAMRFRVYGLTQEGWDNLIERQRGKCAICRKPFAERPFIDHDHETDKVRGILCRSCNTGLGLLGDTVERLSLALDYLNSHAWMGF